MQRESQGQGQYMRGHTSPSYLSPYSPPYRKNKAHWGDHTVARILLDGPPIGNWCMRFEHEHQVIKRRLPITSFKRLPYTVAEQASWALALDLKMNIGGGKLSTACHKRTWSEAFSIIDINSNAPTMLTNGSMHASLNRLYGEAAQLEGGEVCRRGQGMLRRASHCVYDCAYV